MNILILGAGQVGSSVAASLAGEDDNITVIDTNNDLLQTLQDRYDIRTVHGKASYPGVLEVAGAEDADLLLAVTNSDEINIIACQICHNIYHTPTKIARIRSNEYLANPKLFDNDTVSIDMLIGPEQIVTDYIVKLAEHPDALQVLDFAGGLIKLVAIKALNEGHLVGNPLKNLRRHIPKARVRVAAVFRNGKPLALTADTVIAENDEVFFIAASKDIFSVMAELRHLEKPYKHIMLAGGGQIGARLATALENNYRVKIIESDAKRAEILSGQLANTTVLLGNMADEELLKEENIEKVDFFCALTHDDEANILSAMLAKRLGAQKVLSLINRIAYVKLIESSSIDIALSPHQATIGSLLAHIRRGDIVAVHSLRHGESEALEAIAHGDKNSSLVIGRRIGEIALPPGATISAIARNNEVIIPHHDTVIEAEDHIVLFLSDKRYINDIERLFQVGVSFFK